MTDVGSVLDAAPPVSPHALARTPMVTLDAVTHRYGDRTAVEDVSLQVTTGEILGLLGPSGSGKSTLLRLIAGIDRPSQGRVHLDGAEVAGPNRFMEAEQRRVGMVFQDYALFPHLTVAANVAFGLRGRTAAEMRQITTTLLDRVGLAGFERRYPHTLSGGERQRVAVARALAPAPRVLLMDEPFSSLDARLRDRVRQDTIELLRELRTTTIIVTHDAGEAVRVADRLALLRAGRLLQSGSAEELYVCPTTAFAARLFGEMNEIDASCRDGLVATRVGTFPAPHGVEDGPVRVCIRPQHLRISAHPTGVAGTVVAYEFLGERHRVVVATPDLPAPLVAHVAGTVRVRPGDRVHLAVNPSDVIVVADDGQ